MEDILSPELSLYPEKFVMYMFPWGREGTPLVNRTGPRQWQREELYKIGVHNVENMRRISNNEPPIPYNLAISSGRGSGKTALLVWLAYWAMSTQMGCTVMITANTEQQLMSRTWPELGKWHTLALNSHWFIRTATTLRPSPILDMASAGIDTSYYYAQTQLWSEENPDAFAGAHNQYGMVLIMDESSGIPKPIWSVSEGFFTEPIFCRFWLTFSNPRRPQGEFYECFHKNRKFWHTRNIDSRTVEGLDHNIYNKLIDKHGEDSDEARVEVKGEFPRRGSNQLIGYGVVDDACKRHIKPKDIEGSAKIIGVDVAREGTNKTVIVKRQGLFMHEPIELSIPDNMIVADIVANHIMTWQADACIIDRGEGSGVIDRLRQLNWNVMPVYSGGSAVDKDRFLNKRVEMWYDMLQWLINGGVIPDHRQLKEDLSNPTFTFTEITNKMVLESVESMIKRRALSPDFASALAFTFAYTVAPLNLMTNTGKIHNEWNPFEFELATASILAN